jgi:hypothetical protein
VHEAPRRRVEEHVHDPDATHTPPEHGARLRGARTERGVPDHDPVARGHDVHRAPHRARRQRERVRPALVPHRRPRHRVRAHHDRVDRACERRRERVHDERHRDPAPREPPRGVHAFAPRAALGHDHLGQPSALRGADQCAEHHLGRRQRQHPRAPREHAREALRSPLERASLRAEVVRERAPNDTRAVPRLAGPGGGGDGDRPDGPERRHDRLRRANGVRGRAQPALPS